MLQQYVGNTQIFPYNSGWVPEAK